MDLDADRLAAVVTGARATDPAAGLAIEGALERWRGPAYPELGDVDAGRVEAARLEELRILAVERRAEAGLHSGATDELVVELAALADEHPLRERPRELLMAALAASGRTAEALRVYDDFRRLLGEELGIEPSAALTAQHAELLQGTSSAPWSPPHRLPEAVTSLLGRDDLLAEATALVEEHRLVTLLGPGGVGKTRLMVEIGHHLRAARPERPVVLVELASATAESAVDEVAAALAIDGRPDVGLGERLAAVLADLEVVLLLDNCEHVLDPVAELVERLLAACPNVTMVATTRERLRVGGEHLSRCRRSRSTTGPTPRRACSSSEARRCPPASSPAPRTCAGSTRSSGGSTGCPSPSSWPPPASTPSTCRRWPPASTGASGC